MIDQILGQPAFWGFAGAFIYAGPRFSACYWACRDAGTGPGKCFWDLLFSLIIGTIAAAAFTSTVQGMFHLGEPYYLRAVSSLIGLLANRVAPGVVDSLSGVLIKRMERAAGSDK